MDARAVVFCATGGMDNDWQKLGDVVARIVARVEVTNGPPVATDDAAAFLVMLREVYGPPAPGLAAALCGPEPLRKDSR
jgi:hypothetical protein